MGEVDEIGDGIAVISGLRGALAYELVEFTKNGVRGIALNFNADSVGDIIIMGEYHRIFAKATWCAARGALLRCL